MTFETCKRYDSHEQWVADVPLHCVPEGTPYSWQTGEHARTPATSQQKRATCQLCGFFASRPISYARAVVCRCAAGKAKELHGWVVGSRGALPRPRLLPSATRVMRSLYELDADDAMLLSNQGP